MKCINAMAALTELGLLNNQRLYELVQETSPYLAHPNLWVRHSVAGFISTTGKCLSTLDVQCKIMPNIQEYMKYPIIQIDKPELLLESLHAPVSRGVFDSVVKFSDMNTLMDAFESKKRSRQSIEIGRLLMRKESPDMQPQIKIVSIKLSS